MDIQSLVQYKKIKRRERAARMATEAEPVGILDGLDSAEEDTDLLKLKPPRPPRPKKVKETLKEPLYEEDIIEGFSFCSFNNFEDLEVGILLFSWGIEAPFCCFQLKFPLLKENYLLWL